MNRAASGLPAEAGLALHAVADAPAAARRAAALIAAEVREAVRLRGRCALALSGGSSPRLALRYLAEQDLPWRELHLAQVDERLAPACSEERNLTLLQVELLWRVPILPEHVYPLPVEAQDRAQAMREYSALLQSRIGSPPVFDLVHLGLGADGHTASLVPGDPVLEVQDRDVALTREYRGVRRMTLTYPALDRARRILWLVTGAAKAAALRRLLCGDRAIPAGAVRRSGAIVVADAAALAQGADT